MFDIYEETFGASDAYIPGGDRVHGSSQFLQEGAERSADPWIPRGRAGRLGVWRSLFRAEFFLALLSGSEECSLR